MEEYGSYIAFGLVIVTALAHIIIANVWGFSGLQLLILAPLLFISLILVPVAGYPPKGTLLFLASYGLTVGLMVYFIKKDYYWPKEEAERLKQEEERQQNQIEESYNAPLRNEVKKVKQVIDEDDPLGILPKYKFGDPLGIRDEKDI